MSKSWFNLFVILGMFCCSGCQNTSENQIEDFTPTPTAALTATPTPTPVPPTPTSTATPTPWMNREKAYEHFMRGSILMHEGFFDEAADAFIDAYNAYPNSARICANAADALLQSGYLERARQLAKQSIRLAPNYIEGYEVLAECFAALNENENAIAQYETILRLKPDSLQHLNRLANLYIHEKRFEEAVPLFRKIVNQEPQQSTIFRMQLAYLLFNMQRYNEALSEYQQLAEDMPESFDIQLKLGSIYQELGRYDEAINAYLTALNHIHSTDNEITVRKKLGEIYRLRKSYTEAVFQYENIKKLAPNDMESRKTLIRLYARQNKKQNALREVEDLLRQQPGLVSLHELRFDLLKEFGEEKKAYQLYLRALERFIAEPNRNSINQMLGILLHEDSLDAMKKYGQITALQTLLQRGEAMEPKPIRIQFAWVYLYQWSNQQEKQEQHQHQIILDLKQAVSKQNPEKIELICFELLNWPVVRNTFAQAPFYSALSGTLQNAAAMYPSLAIADRTRGALAIDRLDWNTAAAAYENALQILQPGTDAHKNVLFQLVWAYDQLDRVADVEQLLEEAMLHYPNEANVYNYLGYMYADRNMHLDEALSLIEKALKLAPNDPNIMDSLGWVYYRLERYKDALTMLEKAVKLEENHPVIAMHLGDVYAKLNRWQDALKQWKFARENHEGYPGEFSPETLHRLHEKIQEAESKVP